MKVRIDRIVVRGAAGAPDARSLEAAVRAEVARALADVRAPKLRGRRLSVVQTTAPPGAEPARAIAAAVRSALGGAP